MKAELFGGNNGRSLINELSDPTSLFHLSKENTTLHDVSKQSDFYRRFTGSVLLLDLPVVSSLSFLR